MPADALLVLAMLACAVAVFVGTPVLVVVLWVIAVRQLAARSGWLDLGARYPTRDPLPPGAVWLGFVRLRGVPYRNVLRGAATPVGLRLDLLSPFAAGVPSVVVPWSDLRAHAANAETHVDLGGVATLTLSTRTWDRIAGPR